VSKTEHLIWQRDTTLNLDVKPRYISTSPKQKLRNNTDVIDYFAGDNEICE